MYEKLIDEWAEAEGFQCFKADHSAVLRNMANWLDRRALRQMEKKQTEGGECYCTKKSCAGYSNGVCVSLENCARKE